MRVEEWVRMGCYSRGGDRMGRGSGIGGILDREWTGLMEVGGGGGGWSRLGCVASRRVMD